MTRRTGRGAARGAPGDMERGIEVLYRAMLGSIVAVALAAAGAGAAAAAPVVLSTTGSGHSAGAVMDGAGNLHVVWADATADGKLAYRYCRIPAGGHGLRGA